MINVLHISNHCRYICVRLLQFFVLSLCLTPETGHKSVVKVLNLGRWQTKFGDQQTSTDSASDIIIRVQYLMNFDRFELDPFQIIAIYMFRIDYTNFLCCINKIDFPSSLLSQSVMASKNVNIFYLYWLKKCFCIQKAALRSRPQLRVK